MTEDSYRTDDVLSLVQDAERSAREVALLKRELARATAATLAAKHLRDDEFGAIFVDRIGVSITEGRVDVHVLGPDGRPATRWDFKSNKLLPVTFDALTEELKAKWSQLPWRDERSAKADKPSPTKERTEDQNGLTAQMRRQREQKRRETTAPLSDAERAAARSHNPWAPGTFNLTTAMRIERRDPSFAAVLKEAANVAV